MQYRQRTKHSSHKNISGASPCDLLGESASLQSLEYLRPYCVASALLFRAAKSIVEKVFLFAELFDGEKKTLRSNQDLNLGPLNSS